jgi:hypothetical protein
VEKSHFQSINSSASTLVGIAKQPSKSSIKLFLTVQTVLELAQHCFETSLCYGKLLAPTVFDEPIPKTGQ